MPETVINHKPQSIDGKQNGLTPPKQRSFNKIWLWIGGVFITVILILVSGILIWYNIQLAPVGNDTGELKKITIAPGSTSGQIGQELEKQSIIRSTVAFDIFIRLSCKNNTLQAGTYRLSPAENVSQIVEHFVKGSIDTFSIMFYPGATLTDTTNKSESEKQDVTTVLRKAGFSLAEIKTALAKTYTGPLFAGKPKNADLEGYIYGDTYNFNTGASVEDILKRTFEEYYAKIKENKLVEGFAKHGLSLYQGITLASIIQREANKPNDQKQVAQVFYLRLSSGIKLESDVTYQYIADKTEVARDPGLDSPYNTRRYAGLPPGPIATPGLSALLAVSEPATGEYLFFLSGDDNVTYFAYTNTEHEANIREHCKTKCSTM